MAPGRGPRPRCHSTRALDECGICGTMVLDDCRFAVAMRLVRMRAIIRKLSAQGATRVSA